jgi:plastocyanin
VNKTPAGKILFSPRISARTPRLSTANGGILKSERNDMSAMRFHLLLALLMPDEPTTKPSSAVVEVMIDNFTFSPPTITVAPGTTVRWTNKDDVPHTVTSTDKRFKSSKTLDTDDTYTTAFATAGTYAYYCAVHPMMTGTVVVK